MTEKKIFCHHPWTNLGINANGKLKPCCRFAPEEIVDDFGQMMNIKTHSIADYKKTKFLRRTKQQLLDGVWPKGCDRCKYEEDRGIDSKRQLDFTRWQEAYKGYDMESGKFITSNIALGTVCNLKCIMCRPQVSSAWRKEWNTIYNTEYKDFKVTKHNFVEEFTESAPKLIHLDVTGGEPFLNELEQLKGIMQFHIDTDNAKDMCVHLTTNTTIYPDDSIWKLLSHFKEVDMQLSIDGIGKRFEYIRFNAKWDESLPIIKQFIEAEKKYNNVRLSVSCTISAYNIYYLDEFTTWCEDIGLPKPYFGPVFDPFHLMPGVWRADIKAKIAEHLNESSNEIVRQWAASIIANPEDEERFDEFVEFTRTHDEYRKNNFVETFPELSALLKEAGCLNDILWK